MRLVHRSSAVMKEGKRPGKGESPMELCGRELRFRGSLIRIAHIDGEGYQFLENPEAAVGALRTLRHGIDVFTFIQKLSETAPLYSFPMELDNFAALRVTTFDDWMSHTINFKARNKVRKAAKCGVSVREVAYDDEFVRGISQIYNESPVRQGMRFWHYGKDIETVRKINGTFPDRSIYIGAFYEGTMIGFVKLVTDENRGQAGLMQILSMIQHRDKAPTNALVAQAVRSCADRGIPYLWYANITYGKKGEDSLAEFKRHNGFQKLEIPRYYVPLTIAGRIALRFGLHRSLLEWVPAPMTATYRKVRGFWYARKLPDLKNA